MPRYEILEIKNARKGIDVIEQGRKEQGISQMKFAEKLNDPDVGQRYAGTLKRGDAKLSYTIRAARLAGYRVCFIKELIDP